MIQAILNFFKGNVRLAITYWIFGVLPATILVVMFYMMINPDIEIYSITFYVVISGLQFLYFPLIFIAIWNSAQKSTGNTSLRYLSKFSVILGALYIYNGIYNYISHNTLSQVVIREQVRWKNHTLPERLNDHIELTKMSYNDNTVTLDLKVIDIDFSDMDIKDFFDVFRPQLIKKTCNGGFEALTPLLENGVNISFNYDIGDHIENFIVKLSDCQLMN